MNSKYDKKLARLESRVSWLSQLKSRSKFGFKKGDIIENDADENIYLVDNFRGLGWPCIPSPIGFKIKKDGNLGVAPVHLFTRGKFSIKNGE